MIILSNEDVAALLSMAQAIEVVEAAMIEVANGNTTLPLRSIVPVGAGNFMGLMPGVMENPACFGIKLVSLYPNNPKSGISSHQGAMILFERQHGAAIAMMNADLLTAMRTAAASAVATRALSAVNSWRLAIIGTGEQAKFHLAAMVEVRPIRKVAVAGRSIESAERFINSVAGDYPELEFLATGDIQQAVRDADIICTVTAADEPLLFGKWVTPGSHVNVVGSSIPSKREIDTDLLVGSRLFVDYRVSTMAQAGEVMLAIEQGVITADHIVAEIGAVVAGTAIGRRNENEITLYRSLGVAAQDLATAHYVLEKAAAEGRGVKVSL